MKPSDAPRLLENSYKKKIQLTQITIQIDKILTNSCRIYHKPAQNAKYNTHRKKQKETNDS